MKARISKIIISKVLIVVLFVADSLLVLYSTIFFVWGKYYDHLLKKEGHEVIATIIRKDNCGCEYDIEHEGLYYKGWINLTKSAYRKIQVGERFPALILPEKLKYYHENGLTPNCFNLTLIPLPDDLQDIEKEKKRIKEMYEYD